MLNYANWIVEQTLVHKLSPWSGTYFSFVLNFYFHNFILGDVDSTSQIRELKLLRGWKISLLRKC